MKDPELAKQKEKPNFRLFRFLFFELCIKTLQQANSLNAVERESVRTGVLNPNASEASYTPKQRSYRRTKLTFFISLFFLHFIFLTFSKKFQNFQKNLFLFLIFFFKFTLINIVLLINAPPLPPLLSLLLQLHFFKIVNHS